MTIDPEDGTRDITHLTDDEYKEEMRHIEQLASCPCTACTDRCWDTGAILECHAYRAWWYRNNGLRYKHRK